MGRAATVFSDILDGGTGRMRCQIVVLEGPDRGRACAIGDRDVVIGTHIDCDLVLGDDRVSGRHVAIRALDGRFVVRDLGSRNGTWFEGSRVTGEITLPPGAVLLVARTPMRIEPEAAPLEIPPSQARKFGELVGESLAMREVFAVLERVAGSDATVVVEGETGTGKEVVARALHDASSRRKGSFIAVDCGALPESLLESELFGHVRGAFTGAMTGRTGQIARADGGTLFLDELGKITPTVQARLLRVLEERVVRPLGSDLERPVDVRVIAASRDDLDGEVAAGRFRPDLLYRLAVVRVVLPPLRNRREDIPLLVRELSRRRGLADEGPDGPTLQRLLAHGWPGNVRELRNVIDRAIALSPGAKRFSELTVRIEATALAGDGIAVRSDLPYHEAKTAVLHDLERRYVADVLARCQGNLSAAAREAGLDRKYLRSLARKHGFVHDGGAVDHED